MQRRQSAYKVRAASVGEGMLNTEGIITPAERKRMLRRKSSVPENLYVYEITVPEVEEGFDDIIYYKIVIKAIGNIEWTLFRRFSEFFDVHTDITTELATIVFESEFPKKDTFSWFGQLRAKEIDKRRRMLQDWLQEFLSITNGSVRPPNAKQEEVTKMQEKLDAFLEVKEKIRAHTIAQAAKIKPAVDESAIAIYGETPKIVVPIVAPTLKNVWSMAYDDDANDDSGGDEDLDNDKNDSNNNNDNNGGGSGNSHHENDEGHA
jgi:hypothetical protein